MPMNTSMVRSQSPLISLLRNVSSMSFYTELQMEAKVCGEWCVGTMLRMMRKAITMMDSEAARRACFRITSRYSGFAITFFMLSEEQVW